MNTLYKICTKIPDKKTSFCCWLEEYDAYQNAIKDTIVSKIVQVLFKINTSITLKCCLNIQLFSGTF